MPDWEEELRHRVLDLEDRAQTAESKLARTAPEIKRLKANALGWMDEVAAKDKKLALAEETIQKAPHDWHCLLYEGGRGDYCTCWKAAYDSTKDSL